MQRLAVALLASAPFIYAVASLLFDGWYVHQRALPMLVPVILFIALTALSVDRDKRVVALSPLLLCTLALLAPGHKSAIAAGWLAISVTAAAFLFHNKAHEKLKDDLAVSFLAYLVVLVGVILLKANDSTFDWISIAIAGDSARHVGLLGMVGAALFLFRDRKQWWLAAPFIAAIFWSGSRGALFSLIGAVLVAAFLFKRKELPLRLLATSAVGAALSMIHRAPHQHMGIERFFTSNPAGATGDFASGRSLIWQEGIKLIQDSPWFGYGQDQTWTTLPLQTPHLHSDLLQALFDFGVPLGLLLIAAMAGAGFIATRKAIKAKEGTMWLVLAALSLQATMESVFYWPLPGLLWMIALARCLSSNSTEIRPIMGLKPARA